MKFKIPKMNFKKVKIPFSFGFFKNKKVIIPALIGILIVVGIIVYFKTRPLKVKKPAVLAQVEVSAGALERGDRAIMSVVATQTSAYTSAESAASFVGTLYKLSWKSGLDTMARAPVYVWLPIPSNYYFGENTANVQAVELIDGMPYTLYGGQIRTKNGMNYLECITYFPGTIGLTLTNTKHEYGLKLLKKSTTSKNLIIIPGSNMNFVGNIPGTSENIWARNFPNYNVYVFNYPLVSSRSLSTTAKMVNYFSKIGVESYVKYTAKTLADLLNTVIGENYIVAQGVGGLIARDAVESEKVQAKEVILFNTPNSGTSFASSYMLSSLYNAGNVFMSREMSAPTKTVNYVMNLSISYLRLLNFFAPDMAPHCDFLERLNSMEVPSNVRFVSIAGTKPNVAIQASKKLENFFPQLVSGKGDGVVSVKSALSFGKEKYTFPYSFYDIFVHKDVQALLEKLLNSSISSATVTFAPDKFKETKVSTVATKAVRLKKSHVYLPSGDYLLKKPQKGQFLREVYYVKIPQAFKIMGSDMGVYMVSSNSAYFLSIGGYQKIYRGRILFSNVYGNSMYLVTSAMQVLEFHGRLSRFQTTLPRKDYKDVFATGKNVYALVASATSLAFVDVTDSATLLNLPGTNGYMRYFPNLNDFAIVTDKYVALYNLTLHVGTFFEKLDSIMKSIGFKKDQSLIVSSLYVKDGLLYVLSSNYILVAVDMNTHKCQIIGNQDVGNVKLVSYDHTLAVVGESTLNFYDTKNRVRIPFYQKNTGVIDATNWNGMLLLLCKKGGKYEIDGYQE